MSASLLDALTNSLVTKDIRPSTRRSYLASLRPFYGLDMDTLSVADLNEVLLTITNQNTRRKTVIALKANLDHPAVKALRIPTEVPREYDMPDEGMLRFALMLSKHETRLLLGMYAGLRLGEMCAVTKDDLDGRWLKVSRQVDYTTNKLVPTKTAAARVPLPAWLAGRVALLTAPVGAQAVAKTLAVAGRRVGIRLNPHQLRTFYCNHLIEQGHPPHVVQKLMRHANVKVTFTHYARAASGDLERAVANLGGV
jgi:integrase